MATFFFYALWYVQPVLQVWLAVMFFRRKLHRRFPLFFSTVLYVFGSEIVLLAVRAFPYKTYFYTYWALNSITTILSFAVIYELFGAMFGAHRGLKDFGSTLFQWAGVVVALMAILMLATTAGVKAAFISSVIISVQRAVMVMQCGLLLMLVFFMKHLGVTSRHQVFGIILGFGLNASVELILLTQRTRFAFGDAALNIIYMVAFNASLVTWLVYAFLPEPAAVLPNLLLKPQRWSDDLLHASAPATSETVLLGIEGIVDRALTRGNGDQLKTGIKKFF